MSSANLIPNTHCPICDKRMRQTYRLYDRDGEGRGDFCSKPCAEYDAWGPIFTKFKVRKLPGLRARK